MLQEKVVVSSVTNTERGCLSGVASAIQTQLNNQADQSTTQTETEIDTQYSRLNSFISLTSGVGRLLYLPTVARARGILIHSDELSKTTVLFRTDKGYVYTDNDITSCDVKANAISGTRVAQIAGTVTADAYTKSHRDANIQKHRPTFTIAH